MQNSRKNLDSNDSKQTQNGASFSLALRWFSVFCIIGIIVYNFVSNSQNKDIYIQQQSNVQNNNAGGSQRKYYRNNIYRHILVDVDYKKIEFGGIDDVKIMVKNESPYVVDNVTIGVLYVKTNGHTHLTHDVKIGAIMPNGVAYAFAPSTNRGVRIEHVINSITCKALGL